MDKSSFIWMYPGVYPDWLWGVFNADPSKYYVFPPSLFSRYDHTHAWSEIYSKPDLVEGKWEGQYVTPSWIWGTYGTSYSYVFSPAHMKVGYSGYADSAGSVDWSGITNNRFEKFFAGGDHPHVKSGLNFYFDGTADLWLGSNAYGSAHTSYSYLGICASGASSWPSNAGLVRMCKANSSRRYKHDIKPLKESFHPEDLYKLPVRSFIFNKDHLAEDDERYGKVVAGFIAEEMDELFPSAVNHNADGGAEAWNSDFFLPFVVQCVIDQHEEIEELKERVRNLEKMLEK